MRTIEKNFLTGYARKIRKYGREHTTAVDFFEHISLVPDFSLQEKCRKHDYAFLLDIQRIISIIMSIVEHPHISSKQEEIVSRIELVKQLSNEDFTRSLKEPGFWKQRGSNMIPEKVYYYQQVDELAIYENKFICLLVNILENELKEYYDLYLAMLPTVSGNISSVDPSLVDTLKKTKYLLKRINVIKSTRFYRTISKTRPIDRHVRKTNILIHDNLYKRCFMFYNKYLVYKGESAFQKDLRVYYLTIILKGLSERGFQLVKDGVASKKRKWGLKSDDFKISLQTLSGICAFSMTVTASRSKKNAKHLLIISSAINHDGIEIPEEGYDSIDVLTLWNLSNSDELSNNALVSTFSEKELVDKWIDSKTTLLDVSHDMYSTFCPVCKNKVEDSDDEFFCENCRSKYKFIQNKGKITRIWFVNLRR